MSKKNLLITGGAGFIASHVAARALAQGHHVTVIDNLATGSKKNIPAGADFLRHDITSPVLRDTLLKSKKKYDALIHAAGKIDAQESFYIPQEYLFTNVIGTYRILELCTALAIPQMVFFSSGGAVYGAQKNLPCTESTPPRPVNPYGISKALAEQAILLYAPTHKITSTILRFSNVYGPAQKKAVIPAFVGQIRAKKHAKIYGSGNQTRDFLFIDDAVSLILQTVHQQKSGIYNASSGRQTTINTVYRLIARQLGAVGKPYHIRQKTKEVSKSCLDSTKAQRTFGWKPKTPIAAGVAKTIASIR